jgi:hypothetical protein
MEMFLRIIICALFPCIAIAKVKDFHINGYAESQVGVGTANAIKGNAVVNSYFDAKLDDETKIRANLAANFGSATYESRGSSMAIDDAFVSYKHNKYGDFEIGITHPVTEKFRKDASTFARGSGGINGDYFRYVAYSLDSSNMILSPQMPTAGGFATSNYIDVQNNLGTLQNYFNGARGTKISFISNRFNGFLLGASFTPSLYDKFTAVGASQNDITNLQDLNNNFNTTNSISMALNYEKNITEKFNVSISGLYENGKAQKLSTAYDWRAREDLNSWSLGFNAKYGNWNVGGSYINYGRSLFFKSDGTANTMMIGSSGGLSNFDNSYLYNIGVGYEQETWGISSSYFQGNYMNNKSDIANVSFDKTIKYELGTVVHYLELAYVSVTYPNYYKGSTLMANNNTQAFVILGGMRLKF